MRTKDSKLLFPASALLVALMAACFALVTSVPFASAEPASTTSTSIRLQGAAKTQVDDLQAQAAAVQAEIDQLDTELELLTEQYNQLNLNLTRANQDLQALRRQLQKAQQQYQQRQELVEDRVVAAYKSGKNGVLEILLATDSFNDFVKRLVLISRLVIKDQVILDDLEESVSNTAELAREVEQKKSEELRLREQVKLMQGEIETKLNDRKAVLADLDTRIADVIKAEQQRQEEERQRLEAELRQRMATWQPYDGPLPQTGDQVLNQIVETAATYLGIPYVWGGEHPTPGFDCSGLMLYVYRQHGVTLPHYSGYQAQMGAEVSIDQIQTGDLIAFGFPVHHVGMYIGEDKFIHAPRTGDVVKISVLSARSDINTIRRFPIQPREGAPRLD